MDQLLFDILFWGVFVGGGTAFVVFCFIMAVRQYRRDTAKQNKGGSNTDTAPVEADCAVTTIRATVADQVCCAKTIGIKKPRTVKEFLIVFRTEDGKILKFTVPEEMYDGFEQGQTGLLSVIDGNLYSFDLEKNDSAV